MERRRTVEHNHVVLPEHFVQCLWFSCIAHSLRIFDVTYQYSFCLLFLLFATLVFFVVVLCVDSSGILLYRVVCASKTAGASFATKGLDPPGSS